MRMQILGFNGSLTVRLTGLFISDQLRHTKNSGIVVIYFCQHSQIIKIYTRDKNCGFVFSFVVVVVCSGFTSLSTLFQSYHDGVWLPQVAQCSLL